MPICFYFSTNRTRRISGKKNLIERIKVLAFVECFQIGDISIILVDDAEILNINNKYLKHNYYTDIITFDYTKDRTISGDLYISIERVCENAKQYNTKVNDELNRVIIHGLLHLCGYKDKTKKQASLIRKKENYYLGLKID
ncbi:MAG: rRNA maturation RNase YbeY [Bacteroidetes bacterium]|nr:rRNA maturation RNase YbeY [Bacteroidota bacterium]